MESLLNLLIDGIICFGLVSIIMLPIICFIWIMEKLGIMEKLDDKYHWYDKLFNNDEYENE